MDGVKMGAIAPDMKLSLAEMAKAAQGQALAIARGASSTANEVTFGNALRDALAQVSDAQKTSSGLAREFQLGNPDVSLEETMIAAQKAQVGFQAALTVRNRVVQAYQEIMSMNV